MDGSPAASDQRLDPLYRDHPEGFVAGRDRLAKELRAAGDRDEAERVKKLRRPTVAAWIVNRAALSEPAQLEEFADACGRLEAAQSRALEGDDEAVAEWRAAAGHAREATAAVIEVAERVARDADRPPSERALELVGETLRAAVVDRELRELVLSGRVERERSAATLGTPARALPPRVRAAAAKRRGTAEARRELDRLEAELADATEREGRLRALVEQTEEALRREKAKLATAKRETAELKRGLKAAKRRA